MAFQVTIKKSVQKSFKSMKRWGDAATSVPRMAYVTWRHGVMPSGARLATTFRSEGAQAIHWKVLGDSLVEVFRNAGPVLTKFGQILAAREDLLPKDVLLRLEKLYSRQPAMPKSRLQACLKAAYPDGVPFEEFDPEPLGVGSIGQVHRARLGGERVIVKFIRPGIEREVERDMNAARVLTDLVFKLPIPNRKATHFVLSKTLEDLGQGFARETDLTVEADALEDFGQRFRKNPRVYVPRCYRAHSNRYALVMEELRGEPLSTFRERAKNDPEAAKRIAGLALQEILSQIFVDGRFHADPHGGNLLVLEDGRLGLIDLGLTGELTHEDRRNISRAVRAFVKRDAQALIEALLGFGATPEAFDSRAFSEEIVATVNRHKADVKSQVTGGKGDGEGGALEGLVNDLFGVAYRHKLYVPSSATLLIKTLVTIEGVARSIDPEINLVSVAVPVILKSLTPGWMRWGFWKG